MIPILTFAIFMYKSDGTTASNMLSLATF